MLAQKGWMVLSAVLGLGGAYGDMLGRPRRGRAHGMAALLFAVTRHLLAAGVAGPE
jgi:hypothetical protein